MLIPARVLGVGLGVLGVVGPALLAGCGSGPAILPSINTPITRPLTATTPIDAGALVIAANHAHVYDTERGYQVTELEDARPDCHRAGKTWWVRFARGDGVPPDREVKLAIDANRSVALVEEIDRIAKVEIEFSPPLVLIPDKLVPLATGSARFEQQVRMVIHPLGDRSKVRASGLAANVIVYEGDEEVITAAGTFVARKLVATLRADLSIAKTVHTTEQWWADGIGLVFEKQHEVTRAMLGLKIRDNVSAKVLRSCDGPGR